MLAQQSEQWRSTCSPINFMQISMSVLCIRFFGISCNNCWLTKMVRRGLEWQINKDGSQSGEDAY
ncbi:hypothetical protein T10_13581 [Trichinella papuae]|uniref:Uncharacterized protein n=1 Tax=Trichinella papuae TaxID=268474 RepID=A0A0V1M3R4_9BILA|nr:hypothetical protein T10_13581 [Trichinella papuae]